MDRLHVVHQFPGLQARPGSAAHADDNGHHPAQERSRKMVIDGPFAETKEQLLAFYMSTSANLDESGGGSQRAGQGPIPAVPMRSAGAPLSGRPCHDRRRGGMTDAAWIDKA